MLEASIISTMSPLIPMIITAITIMNTATSTVTRMAIVIANIFIAGLLRFWQ